MATLKGGQGFNKSALALQGIAQVAICLGIIGPDLDGLAIGDLSLGMPPQAAEGVAQVVVCLSIIGLELDGLAAGRFCLRILSLVTQGIKGHVPD
jgi:hypothetical protein